MVIKQHAMHVSWRRLGALALLAGIMLAAPVFDGNAQRTATLVGTLNAEAQGPIPQGAAVRVHASSGAPEIQAIADLFREALEEKGHGPAPTGGSARKSGEAYVLSFRISGDSPEAGGRSAFELSGSRGSAKIGEAELKMRWKMRRGDTVPTVRRRRLSVSIADPDNNQVWRAQVEIRAGEADDLAVVDALLPALLANLGRTVYALRVP